MRVAHHVGRRSAARQSVALFHIHQVFDIALRSADRRKIQSAHRKAHRPGKIRNACHHLAVQRRVAHHAVFADAAPAHLELRFNQAHAAAAHLQKPECFRQHQRQRNKRYVRREKIHRRHLFGRQRPDIGFFQVDDARIAAQRRRQLAGSDVYRIHPRRTGLQHTIGKSAGRRTDVQRRAAGQVDREHTQRFFQLAAAAADKRHPLGVQRNLCIRRYVLRRFGDGRTVNPHAAGLNQFLGLRTAARQPALHQQHIQSITFHAAPP